MSIGGWWWLEVKSLLSGWLMFLVLLKDGTQDESNRGIDPVIIRGVGYNATKW